MEKATFPLDKETKKASCRCLLLIAAAVFAISGCAAQGAKRVPADRFDYNAAIAHSTREQMLLNIVRSRYLEVPVFLSVSSVLTQYEYERRAGLGTILEFGSGTTDTATGEANLGFSERPTITYLPVEGQEFSAHLLSDIPADIIFAAAQAGWPVDVFMRIGVQRLGTVENMSFGELPGSGYIDVKTQFAEDLQKLKRFERVIELIFILADSEIIEVQQVEENDKSLSYLIIADKVPEDLRPLLGELRSLIGLNNRSRFRITDRVTNIKSNELSIQTRSVMAMMEFMARGVEVPAAHLEEGRVIDYGLQSSDGEVARGLIPFRMRSSKSRPQNVFAAVRFNDYWYYIDHNDITSKRALSLIIVLFRLQAPTPAGAAPILTLPTG
ncbi:MAG: hypothetical protein QNJ58_16055 [Desulfobacterales bacterium]|nr:hypothetical protein [Desulfobacterales bacterium]